MSLVFSAQVNNLKEQRKVIENAPLYIEDAKNSALKSIGYETQKTLKQHIKQGGAFSVWPELHPIRQHLSRSVAGNWIQRRGANTKPLSWAAQYSRYWLEKEKSEVHVALRDVDPQNPEQGPKNTTLDKSLRLMPAKHERGKTIVLNEEMREKLFVAARKAGVPPIRETTKTITVPKREIMGPVYRHIKPKIKPFFKLKFISSFKRHVRTKRYL